MPGFACSGPGGAWARAGDASARIAAAAAINAAKPAVLGKLKLIEVFYLIPDVAPGVALHRTGKFTRWKSRSIHGRRLPANSIKIAVCAFICVFVVELMAARTSSLRGGIHETSQPSADGEARLPGSQVYGKPGSAPAAHSG